MRDSERLAPLWAVTTYYNPAGYTRRLRNYRAFRRNLEVPLLTVELAPPGRHVLTSTDAEILVQLTGEDRIWQKERLLNLGIARLPPHVAYVAWVDCDVLFADAAWPARAAAHLAAHGGIVQLFERSVHLPHELAAEDVTVTSARATPPLVTGISVPKGVRTGTFEDNDRRLATARDAPTTAAYYRFADGHNCFGLAWAARREELARAQLYDRNVVGGGDGVPVQAGLGLLPRLWTARRFAPAHRADIEAWARRAADAGLLAHVGHLGGDVYHLWHGTFRNRNYRGRYDILARHAYDPTRDVRLADNGAWAWSDPAGPLARDVAEYFFARREDST